MSDKPKKLIVIHGWGGSYADAANRIGDLLSFDCYWEKGSFMVPRRIATMIDQVDDAIVARVQKRVLEGMGLICLHSAHFSKIFRRILGTNCSLKWREAAEKERLWNLEPGHPITKGIGEYIELPNAEMYGERFDIPTPDKLLFVSWFEGGEVFRSGCCWERGHGRIFYFRPGHESYPIFYNTEIQLVIANAVRWAKPRVQIEDVCPETKPLEALSEKDVDFGYTGIVQTAADIG